MYWAREAGWLTGVSGDRIGQWARRGYIRSDRSDAGARAYRFQDVAEAMVVHELLELGLRPREIRRAVANLRREYGDWPLTSAPLALTQLDWHLASLATLLRRGGWVIRTHPEIDSIEVDPDRLGGTPTIRHRRVPAEKVAVIAEAYGGRAALREDYDLTEHEIDDAVSWYRAVTGLAAA
jgi:uncharacterized protein (DUF433 family)